ESRLRKGGDRELYFLSRFHSRKVFFENVRIDPNARQIDDLEQVGLSPDAGADGGVTFNDDSIDRRVERKNCGQIGFLRKRGNRRVVETEYQQVTARGGERGLGSVY